MASSAFGDLPREVISHLFGFLSSANLGLISGTCIMWYQEAERTLAKRDVTLYRHPMPFPNHIRPHLMLAGRETLTNLPQPLGQGVLHMTIIMDKALPVGLRVFAKILPRQPVTLRLNDVLIDKEQEELSLLNKIVKLKLK